MGRTNGLRTIRSMILDGRRLTNSQLVKPLDQNAITRLGRQAKKTIIFALELPLDNQTAMNYSSSLRLFFPNRPEQSIVDHAIFIQSLPSIKAEFLASSDKLKSGRSIRVRLRHLCPSYLEVKAIVYRESPSRVIDEIPSSNICSDSFSASI